MPVWIIKKDGSKVPIPEIEIPEGYKLVPVTEEETTQQLKNGCLRLCKLVRDDTFHKPS